MALPIGVLHGVHHLHGDLVTVQILVDPKAVARFLHALGATTIGTAAIGAAAVGARSFLVPREHARVHAPLLHLVLDHLPDVGPPPLDEVLQLDLGPARAAVEVEDVRLGAFVLLGLSTAIFLPRAVAATFAARRRRPRRRRGSRLFAAAHQTLVAAVPVPGAAAGRAAAAVVMLLGDLAEGADLHLDLAAMVVATNSGVVVSAAR
mmetsp:Transcript_106092/g.266962  ORF Transcript_106092/g.266962 Transcript_106092/m.266962 type:complete len:206 (+) Transcript_106092:275-892(+)